MTKNICTYGRVVRIVIGLLLASLAFFGPKSPWFLLGLILVVTGAIGYCPILRALNKDKNCCFFCKNEEEKK